MIGKGTLMKSNVYVWAYGIDLVKHTNMNQIKIIHTSKSYNHNHMYELNHNSIKIIIDMQISWIKIIWNDHIKLYNIRHLQKGHQGSWNGKTKNKYNRQVFKRYIEDKETEEVTTNSRTILKSDLLFSLLSHTLKYYSQSLLDSHHCFF